jgi:hypothetical protein
MSVDIQHCHITSAYGSKSMSSRAQKIASVPEAEFEAVLLAVVLPPAYAASSELEGVD